MMRLKSDLLEAMLAVVDGKLEQAKLVWDERAAVSVVATSRGYPGKYQTSLPITGIADAECMRDVRVFQGGTKMHDGQLVTDGGRVLSVTALGDSIAQARHRAYEAMKKIHFEGMHYRRDIAHQAIKLS
jgi:phosphoribosylamine--glycine ligase